MMGKTGNQMQLIVFDIDSMVPQNHLLRQIKNCVNFEFIYEKAAPYYSHTGRKSIDPVIMIKMLLIQIMELLLVLIVSLLIIEKVILF